MKTLILGGRVMDPASGLNEERDLVIDDGRIAEIVPPGQSFAGDFERINASGLLVVPGLLDIHVHFREPGFEHKETIATGAASAVAGGFTTVVCMANTKPVNDNPETTRLMLDASKAADLARVFPVGTVTKGMVGDERTDMGALLAAGVVGFSDDGKCVMSAKIMYEALLEAKEHDAVITVHAIDDAMAGRAIMHEGEQSRKLGFKGVPAAAEDTMVARDCLLALHTGARVHIQHVSTRGAVEIVRWMKGQGAPVTAEAAPHHWLLTDKDVGDGDPNFKMAPPLREDADREAIIHGLADGTLDNIATDHAPHDAESKSKAFPDCANGIIGLETSFPLTWDLVRAGHISEMRALEL
ncbi:dihydroorotase, partial [bacterium]|nr:dihydroorotase [bacterium]